MSHSMNPYDHLPMPYLERQLKKVSKKISRIAMTGKDSESFEHQRILMNTLADAITRKKETAWLEKVTQNTTD